MNSSNKLAVSVYVVVSLAAIGVLLYFLIRCEKKNCDGFCICTGQGGQVCQPDMSKTYAGGLTEYSNLAALQRMHGGPKWPTKSPGDYDYPPYDKNCVNDPTFCK